MKCPHQILYEPLAPVYRTTLEATAPWGTGSWLMGDVSGDAVSLCIMASKGEGSLADTTQSELYHRAFPDVMDCQPPCAKRGEKKLTSPPLSCYITVFGHSDTEQTKIHNCFLKDSKCVWEDYLRKVHFSQCLGKSVLNRKHTDQGEWDWAHTLLPSPKRITLRYSWLGKLLWRCGVKTSNWGCAVSLCVLGLW